MNEELDRLNAQKKSAAFQKLADHLASLDTQSDTNLPLESDMLSQIVSGALNGEDIAIRYPALYRKLLENAELRQAFLDALSAVETEQSGQMIPFPGRDRTDLPFLEKRASSSVLETFDKKNWRATLQRSLEQIQSIFSPPELAYRADANLIEDPWFTLLREDVSIPGAAFDVVLECTLSRDMENAFSTFLSLAVTLGDPKEGIHFPLQVGLHWGNYDGTVMLAEEGRVRFPDIPSDAIFDLTQNQPRSGFSLTVQTVS